MQEQAMQAHHLPPPGQQLKHAVSGSANHSQEAAKLEVTDTINNDVVFTVAHSSGGDSCSMSPTHSSTGVNDSNAPGSCAAVQMKHNQAESHICSDNGAVMQLHQVLSTHDTALVPALPHQLPSKQLAAPALSLDGTVWPKLPPPQALSSQPMSGEAADTSASGTLASPVPHLPLQWALLASREPTLAGVDLVNTSSPETAEAAASAPPVAVAEEPWTQNTARALRRAQQEVVHLCEAQGLPLPNERGYCFDLIGIRAAGYGSSSNSRPIASCSGGGGSMSGAKARAAAGNSSNGSGTSMCGSTAAASVACSASGGMDCSGLSPAGMLAAPGQPSVILQLQQRRGFSNLGLQQQSSQSPQLNQQSQQDQQQQQPSCKQHPHLASAAMRHPTSYWDNDKWPWLHQEQQQLHSLRHETPEEQQRYWQHQLQKERPRSTGGIVGRPGRPKHWDETWPWPHQHQQKEQLLQQPHRPYSSSHASRDCKWSKSASARQLDSLQLMQRVEQSLEVHVTRLSSDAALTVGGAGLRCELPPRWWETHHTALSDPLLLQMPVWIREALELELMQ